MPGKVKLVRFRNPTNRGMLAYRVGHVYSADASVQKWLADCLDPADYELLEGGEEDAAEPDMKKPPKIPSRLASSRRKEKDHA